MATELHFPPYVNVELCAIMFILDSCLNFFCMWFSGWAPAFSFVSQYEVYWINVYCYSVLFKYIIDLMFVIGYFVSEKAHNKSKENENRMTMGNSGGSYETLTRQQRITLIVVFIFCSGFISTIDTYSRIVHHPINTFKIRKFYIPVLFYFC